MVVTEGNNGYDNNAEGWLQQRDSDWSILPWSVILQDTR